MTPPPTGTGTAGPKTLVWSVLIALFLMAAGWFGMNLRATSRLRVAARQAVAGGRYAEASVLIERWLKAAPESAEGHYLEARVALGMDRPEGFATGLDKAKALGHPKADLDVLWAVIATKKGRHAEAEPVLRRAFWDARGPDPLVDEALAKVYLETFDFDRAGSVIERWAREAPHNPKPYLWRVEIDSRMADDPLAVVRDYREALKRDPNLAKARLGLADELRAAHQCAEAAPEYDEYLLLRPDDPAGHVGAGRNALELGDEARATAHFDQVLRIDPGHAVAHWERGKIELRRGEVDRALTHLDLASKANPGNFRIHYCRALTLSRLGRADEARAERAVFAKTTYGSTCSAKVS